MVGCFARALYNYRKLFPKWAISSCSSPPLPHFFATFSEGRFLNAFWSPFGSLWTPFGCILVMFWLPFTCLWLPFGSLLVPFGSLLVPLSLDFLIFGGSWRHSSYLVIFSKKIFCRIIFLKKEMKIQFMFDQMFLCRFFVKWLARWRKRGFAAPMIQNTFIQRVDMFLSF